MKEVIEQLLLVEKEAKRIIADAEERSKEMVRKANLKSREIIQKEKESATEKGQKLYQEMIAQAREEKKTAIETAALEEPSVNPINNDKREKAVRFVISAITGL